MESNSFVKSNHVTKLVEIQAQIFVLWAVIALVSKISIVLHSSFTAPIHTVAWLVLIFLYGKAMVEISKNNKIIFSIIVAFVLWGFFASYKYFFNDADSFSYHLIRIYHWKSAGSYLIHPAFSIRELIHPLTNSLWIYSFSEAFLVFFNRSPMNTLFLISLIIEAYLFSKQYLENSKQNFFVLAMISIPSILTTQITGLQELSCAVFFLHCLRLILEKNLLSLSKVSFAIAFVLILSMKFFFVIPLVIMIIYFFFQEKYYTKLLGNWKKFLGFIFVFLLISNFELNVLNQFSYGHPFGSLSRIVINPDGALGTLANFWRYLFLMVTDTVISLKLPARYLNLSEPISSFYSLAELVSQIFTTNNLGLEPGLKLENLDARAFTHFPSPITSYMGFFGFLFFGLLFKFKKIINNKLYLLILSAIFLHILIMSHSLTWWTIFGRFLIPCFILSIFLIFKVFSLGWFFRALILFQIIIVSLFSYSAPIINLRYFVSPENHSLFPAFRSLPSELETFTRPISDRKYYEEVRSLFPGYTYIYSGKEAPYLAVWPLSFGFRLVEDCDLDDLKSKNVIFITRTDKVDECSQFIKSNALEVKALKFHHESQIGSEGSPPVNFDIRIFLYMGASEELKRFP